MCSNWASRSGWALPPRFSGCLKAEAKLAQQTANQLLTGHKALLRKSPSKMALASAHPKQGCLGIATGGRLYEFFQRNKKARFNLNLWSAATTRATDAMLQTRGTS